MCLRLLANPNQGDPRGQLQLRLGNLVTANVVEYDSFVMARGECSVSQGIRLPFSGSP